MAIETIILLLILAFIAELIDSSLGMMYGTLLSPLLIIMGFEPLVVIPSLLFSQALGGTLAAIFHNRYANANFRPKTANLKTINKKIRELGIAESFKRGFGKDFKIAFIVTILGVLATFFASLVAINIPKSLLKGYIGVLVLVMGVIVLSRFSFNFTWKKMLGIGILSSFNKGLSGGGFGPVVTCGQVISGNDPKSSIAVTTLSEVPICLTGFLTFALVNGFSNWSFVAFLTLGAMLAAPLGPLLTSRLNEKKIKPILGVLAIALGLWILYSLL